MRLAVASEVVGMLPMTSSLAHLDLRLRLAEEARARGLPMAISQRYDEAARRHWAECTRAGVVGFSPKIAALAIDSMVLRRAEGLVAQKGAKTNAASNEGVASCFMWMFCSVSFQGSGVHVQGQQRQKDAQSVC